MRHLELSDAELQVVRNALVREMSHAFRVRGVDLPSDYWKKVHEIASRVIDRIDGRVSAATPTADPPGTPTPLVGLVPSVGVAAELPVCDVCKSPKQFADPRVRLCNTCRTRLHKVLVEEVL